MDASSGVVKDLQAALFPVCTKGNYLTNFLQNTLKSNQVEINTDSRTLRPVAKLKEPRDLFALSKELDCPQQAPRWPTECQVLEDRVCHVNYIPSVPEQYYQPTGQEVQPKPVGEEAGQVIFQYYPMSAVNYFSRSSVGGSKYFLAACPNTQREEGLRFESRFESGNLAKVVQITETYYELYLRTDMYTNRHMQWFYFRIENTRTQTAYRFSIVNLSKAESLYNEGMKPLLYSTKDAQRKQVGWKRCGANITYFKNEPSEEDQVPSYTLSFNMEFPYDNDHVYLAHCYPYTYSDLQDYLIRLQNHPVKSTFSKLRLLCRSLAGNNVYYLTITAPSVGDEAKKKKAIIITARVHPGETPSSWMMKGFMDFLTGDSEQAKALREKFIFKLVPMLNPDGVIVGNNRCSLTGRDLNRQYRTVIRETYPPIWHTKLMIRRLMEECGVELYCDLHAHSRRHNIFIYGCESRRTRLQEQVFPLMLHKNAADKFSFENCKFRIQRSKEGTGRVVIWMMGVSNSFTMEASFSGSTLGGRTGSHFNTQDFEQMGRHFCETLLDFCDNDPSKNMSTQTIDRRLQERLRNKIMNRLHKEGSNADEPTNINLSDYSSDEGDTSSESSEELGSCSKQRACIGGAVPPSAPPSAPPPSPVLPRPGHNAHPRGPMHRSRAVAPLAVEKSSPPPREMLRIKQANIDMDLTPLTDADTDLCDPIAEMDSDSSCRQSFKHASKCSEKCNMPPELMVTPAQVYDGQVPVEMLEKLTVKDKNEDSNNASNAVSAEYSADRYRPRSWHHIRCAPAKTGQRYMSDLASELQNKIGSSLRQKIWTGIPCICHTSETDTHWSKSSRRQQQQQPLVQRGLLEDSIAAESPLGPVASPTQYLYSEHLLKSCSEKLESLQRKERTAGKHESVHRHKQTKHKPIAKQFCFVTSSSFDERNHMLKHTKTSSHAESLDCPEIKRSKRKEQLSRNSGKNLRHNDKVVSGEEANKSEMAPAITQTKIKKAVKAKIKSKDVDLKLSQSGEQKKGGKELGKLRGLKRIKHKARKDVGLEILTEREIQKQNEGKGKGKLDYINGTGDFVPSEMSVENETMVGWVGDSEGTANSNETDAAIETTNESPIQKDAATSASSPKEKKKRSLKWKFRKSVLVAATIGSMLSGTSDDAGRHASLGKNSSVKKTCKKKDTSNEPAKKV